MLDTHYLKRLDCFSILLSIDAEQEYREIVCRCGEGTDHEGQNLGRVRGRALRDVRARHEE